MLVGVNGPTHKHTYNALSAVGVIFGQETGKPLYLGVRNKYCSVCKKDPTKEHTCFKTGQVHPPQWNQILFWKAF